jgi:glycosyltransferase involved in cell wall biosynthesis
MKSPRLVVVSGLELFSQDLVRLNNQMGTGWEARYLPLSSWRGVMSGMLNLAVSDVWHTIGTPKLSRSMRSIARLLRKPHIMHWVGTDIVVASRMPSVLNDLRDEHVTNLTETAWEAEELRASGIDAQIAPLPIRFRPTYPAPPLPDRFTLLAYQRSARPEFYGKEELEALIRLFSPRIDFLIVGGGEPDVPPGARVTNLGWTESLADVYRRSTALLRFTHRDGLSLMVLEALAFGRYVLWTKELPFVTRVRTFEEIVSALRILVDKHENGVLKPQNEAVEFIAGNYDPTQCLHRIVSYWESVIAPAYHGRAQEPDA